MIVPTILYLNLENTLIPRTVFPRLMSGGRESYLTALKTMDSRISLVAPAKDWVMFAVANPEIIELVNEERIAILPTLFSHALPDLFPDTMEMQLTLSSAILKKLFENITWHGIIPENTLSSVITHQARKYWKGAILSVGHNNSRGLQTGNYQLQGIVASSMPLKIIANAPARLKYMQMYREETSASTVLNAMSNSDSANTCLFDFERPWSNVVYYPHLGKSHARLDIWRIFHKELRLQDMLSFDSEGDPDEPLIHLDPADLGLWNNRESHWLIEIQKETMTLCHGRGDYFELASLVATSSMPPRVLTRFMQDDSFPTTFNGKPGVVDLVGDMSKVKEALFICKNIRQKRRVDYGAEFLPKGERLYLELLHRALVWTDQHIA